MYGRRKKRSKPKIQKKKKSEENITKSTRNLFKLEKENEIIKDLKE